VTVREVPELLCLDREDAHLLISHKLDFNGVAYALRGVVYAGQHHFTCRVVDSVGTLYRHDGITNGNLCEREADL
ncbi:hypothetical protein EV122DRAFT_199689, partial [Schizophyllum commune]